IAASPRAREPMIVIQERYARAVEAAGAVPLVLPVLPAASSMRAMIENLDGLVVSGGNFDIHPKFYGEKPITALGEIKQERTDFELGLIALALKRDLPLLGICGGAQAINVALGGSLYQDIDAQRSEHVEHQRSDRKDRDGHEVAVHDKTKLRKIVARPTLVVNTTHHQAVKAPGKNLIVNATAHDGVIEGIESTAHRFVLGVQWHPEFLVHRDAAQRKIFAAFVAACK
ncbi:MAG TPA: gamma-glutamyl-gamma-aminobutyrate hydrolase family protein, partial [Candidatus Binatia bacterium]|nr:gamma-glutamyl-gamma-aminobutyrate hydrolase family protein [Candidatus Binatia bacterium]